MNVSGSHSLVITEVTLSQELNSNIANSYDKNQLLLTDRFCYLIFAESNVCLPPYWRISGAAQAQTAR